MKKVKAFSIACLMAFGSLSCTKDNDFVKEELEKALPSIEITSMGLLQQVGPFAQADAIRVTFGGALTKSEPGSFDLAWYTVPTSGAAALVDSVHFDKWTVDASNATANNAISTEFLPTTYPNTNAFSGNLTLKLSKLPGGSKSYTLRLYARTKDSKMATVAVSRFVTIK